MTWVLHEVGMGGGQLVDLGPEAAGPSHASRPCDRPGGLGPGQVGHRPALGRHASGSGRSPAPASRASLAGAEDDLGRAVGPGGGDVEPGLLQAVDRGRWGR